MWAHATRAWGGLTVALAAVCAAHAAAAQTAMHVIVNQWPSGYQAEVRVANPSAAPLRGWMVEMDLASQVTSIWNAEVVSRLGARYVIRGAPWNADVPPGGTVTFGFVASPVAAPTRLVVVGGSPAPTASATRPPATATRTATRTPTRTATRTATRPPATATRSATAVAPTATRTLAPPSATATRTATTAAAASATPTATIAASGGVRVTFARPSVWDGGYTGEVRITNTGGAAVSGWTLQFDLADRITTVWSGVLQTAGPPHYAVRHESWNGVIAAGATVAFGFGADGTSGVPAACRFNGTPCAFVVGPAPTATPGAGAAIQIAGVDAPFAPVRQLTVAQGVTDLALTLAGGATPAFSVASNNPAVASGAIVAGTTLRLHAMAAGRAGLRITDATTGAVRHLGVRVRTAAGALPGLPDHLAIGSVSEDTAVDLGMWRGFGSGAANRRVDIRYIYLNGGPLNGWYDWQGGHGARARSYIRESQMLGMIPFFVWYNIPDAGESYVTDLAHIQSAAYMTAYWRNLLQALAIIREEAGDDVVGLVLEPDFIGYMMQQSGLQPQQIMARVHTAYDSGVLRRGVDPHFPDTLTGLVQAVNYLIAQGAPHAVFGWQFNLWASLTSGSGIPASGLMRITDSLGLAAGRARIALEAERIADYYLAAGVASYGAHFVSLDKYGLDGGFGGGATAPWHSTWFWNAIHWNNYLRFTAGLHARTGLPVVLWQLPVGHVNRSLAANPYAADGTFPPLDNTTQRYEDSAPTFFYGDRFDTGGDAQRLAYFGAVDPDSPASVVTSGSVVTWRPHLEAARDAGVIAALFGDGVGESTRGRGDPPPDGWWWMVQTQAYLAVPVPLR